MHDAFDFFSASVRNPTFASWKREFHLVDKHRRFYPLNFALFLAAALVRMIFVRNIVVSFTH